jgi:UV DNA damage endonuclease
MVRLGLCCQFVGQAIAFRRLTATALGRCERAEQLRRLAAVCRHNAAALGQALAYCESQGIGAFRVNSQILPLCTHPEVGYRAEDLPGSAALVATFRQCGRFAADRGLRLSFHPDQFVVLSSPDEGVRDRSLAELRYQAQVAEWIGADVINIHAGGAYGDKPSALARLGQVLAALPTEIHGRLTLENDDRVYTPAELLPVCRSAGVPLAYDVHHHRCLQDELSVDKATQAALSTWGQREPLFHLSSPRDGWTSSNPSFHADDIDQRDFPACWRGLSVTIDVEAKAKELAVLRLRQALAQDGVALWSRHADG